MLKSLSTLLMLSRFLRLAEYKIIRSVASLTLREAPIFLSFARTEPYVS